MYASLGRNCLRRRILSPIGTRLNQHGQEANECYPYAIDILIGAEYLANNTLTLAAIIEDARHPNKYRMLLSMVDVIFADVAQPDQ